MRKYRSAIKLIPFIMLAGCAGSFLLKSTDARYVYEWFRADLFSSSLATSLFMLFYAKMHKFCTYSFVAIFTLIAFSLLNIVYFFVDMPYYDIFGSTLIYSGFALTTIYYVSGTRRNRDRAVT